MKKTKIYLGWCSTGTREDVHIYLYRDLLERYGDLVDLVLPDVCAHRIFHDRARNDVVEEFLATDCDILWFLDSDVVPPTHILDLVVHHQDKWSLAGAPYPIWSTIPGTAEMSINFTVYNKISDEPAVEGAPRGIHMAECPEEGTGFVDGLATGCLFIKRDVFEKLEKPYFEFKYDKESRRIVEGEDLGFALKCHDLGYKFFVDYAMVCKHMKKVCLLDMQNYSTKKSNAKTLEYDRLIRESVNAAMKAAYNKGYTDAQNATKTGPAPKKSNSGLILPAHY